jgi:hypothetical protein
MWVLCKQLSWHHDFGEATIHTDQKCTRLCPVIDEHLDSNYKNVYSASAVRARLVRMKILNFETVCDAYP